MTNAQRTAETSYLATMYQVLLSNHVKPSEAARMVDREMIVRMLIRKLHREPTELEISRAFARL